MKKIYYLMEHSINDGDSVLVISHDEYRVVDYARNYLQGFGFFNEYDIKSMIEELEKNGLVNIDEELQLEIYDTKLI